MAGSQEQQQELELFKAEATRENPEDFVQFGANYFNKRLEVQRAFVKRQEKLALSKNIVLFPRRAGGGAGSLSHSNSGSATSLAEESARGASVSFKSPFQDNDPKAKEDVSASPSATDLKSGSSGGGGGLFKGGFDIGKDASGGDSRKRVNSPLDPASMTQKRQNSPPPADAHPVPQQQQQRPIAFNADRRTSVSGETLHPNLFDDWVPEHYKEKSSEQLHRLEKSIGKNFLFNKLDADSKRLVINCLEEKHVAKDAIIIKQGEEGDYFYIVENGTVEFYVGDHRVSTSGPGSSFGELALMYNNPRAATVVATSDCILWALDRLTFRKILLGNSFKKRVMYDDLLKSIPVLKSLTTYERSKLADALDTQIFEPGSTIIREGESGENFYLIEYGEVEVSKKGEGVVNTLHKGDYFGEIALLKDIPRQATIRTTKRTKVASLGKSGFERLLGPALDVLKLNDPTRKQPTEKK
ncbi:cAMP-dependent protein kinase regulatory subunit BCY1 KNAG_0H02830 [Huiozyma naganishii CBS 8797]|uniref:cAMP-dependent protein kinase regulatory subunit n=1 Tax=Huiozyma naganishii (strain ATCC MYA-139 / BCRC 22969 / CBS 8797 / KCTC 17520 / NBRC 10181 / NCYC 3082 / Yp74L-3) TaxID=1071383 RepID=J7RPN6_HUIN7|nr:hypothetical protein KNAG_0H02830 [Kazachstania naganishii CBS 8797]CCK71698.1 hypothetical protein KNAG_0H02830 [Kazachstania naganishii CBS 8797]